MPVRWVGWRAAKFRNLKHGDMINVWWQKSLYLVGDKTNIPCFYAQNNTKVAGAISPEQYLLDSQAYQYKYP